MSKDVADLFAAEGENARAILEGLKMRGVDALDLALSEAPKGSTRQAYRYAQEQVVPLIPKIEDEGERLAALADAARALGLKARELRWALKVTSRQDAPDEKAEGEDKPQPGTARYERAMELLRCPDLLGRAAADMEKLGHVGENETKQLSLICALSARAGYPTQPSTHAQSAAGKNALWDTSLSLCPPEMVIRRSGLSAKALFRTQANLKGAVLYIQEVAGSESADYTIRVLQSDGRLEYEATEKMPDGQLRNVVYSTEGPTVIVQTTTKNHLHHENETRVFPIYIDESEEQTARIIQTILREASGEGTNRETREAIFQVWHDGVRLLEPKEVVIAFASRIVIPISLIRIRRDARRLLDVIRVVAWLHQHQREKDAEGRILATEEDFHKAVELVTDSLRRAWQSLTPAEEKVFEAIKELPENLRSQGFRRRDLKVRGISGRRVNEILKSLADNCYLDCDGRPGPQGYVYTLARDIEKNDLSIFLSPSPDSPQVTANLTDVSGDGVSPDTARLPSGEGYQEAGANGRNGHRPINSLDLEGFGAIWRSGGDDSTEKSDAVEPEGSESALTESSDFFTDKAHEEAERRVWEGYD